VINQKAIQGEKSSTCSLFQHQTGRQRPKQSKTTSLGLSLFLLQFLFNQQVSHWYLQLPYRAFVSFSEERSLRLLQKLKYRSDGFCQNVRHWKIVGLPGKIMELLRFVGVWFVG